MADLDRLLRSDVSRAAGESVQHPDFSAIERRGMRRRRNRTMLTVAAATAVVVLVGLGSTRILVDDSGFSLVDQTPQPSPSMTDLTVPLRRDPSMPLVSPKKAVRAPDDVPAGDVRYVLHDGEDVVDSLMDIKKIYLYNTSYTDGYGWLLELRTAPARALEAEQRIIEYGLVVDADGDRVADCQIGINNDAPEPGDLRVWVKNLRTGVADERVGPPYGYPIEHAAPHPGSRFMNLFFPPSSAERTCDRFHDSASFYAWAAVRDAGKITAIDYAPDAAWLRMP